MLSRLAKLLGAPGQSVPVSLPQAAAATLPLVEASAPHVAAPMPPPPQVIVQTQYLTHPATERLLNLAGQQAGFLVRGKERIRHLGDVEFRVRSQWGEDGIIDWLCERLPAMPRSFVEFGVENFAEANCRFLLENRGWKGLIFDGNDGYMAGLRDTELYWKFDLTAVAAFITAENINGLITEHGFAGELGILSVDIDGNDFWVLKAIDVVQPWLVIAEVNTVFGDLQPLTVPYWADFDRFKAHYSGQYFGCSVESVRQLLANRGYTYLGTNTNGVNAFFCKTALCGDLAERVEQAITWPQRHRDSRNLDVQLDFQRGLAKYDLIKDLPVVNTVTGALTAVKDAGPLYSPAFLAEFR